jgi:hypothetical protein
MRHLTRPSIHRANETLIELASATGICHRARRAVREKRHDEALASQLDAVAAELQEDPRFLSVANELRLSAVAIRSAPAPHFDWSGATDDPRRNPWRREVRREALQRLGQTTEPRRDERSIELGVTPPV